MTASPDEPDAPMNLPPPEKGEDGDELADEELGELLPEPDDEISAEEGTEAADTDTNVELPAIPDAADDVEGGEEIAFDTSELVRFDKVDTRDSDDVLGMDDFDGSSELSDEPGDRSRDEAVGMGDDDAALVDESELPELDADDGPAEDTERWGSLEIVSNDVELAAAPEPWPMRLALSANERCSALAVSEGVCATGSADLIWFDHALATPLRTAVDGTRISSLALVGREPKIALCVTGFGRLFRRERRASAAERVADWKRAAELSGSGPEGLELCQLGPDSPHSVVACLSSGRLLRSDDAGLSWQPIETPLTAFAISPTGTPLAALSKGGARLSLSMDGGRSWEAIDLEAPALSVAYGEEPLLAAAGPVVAIAEFERGLVVSADGAKTFSVVPGCGNVTALGAGFFAERPSVWAALYHEATDRTSIALVDVTRAEASVIGTIEFSEALDPENAGERALVKRVCWDGAHLWAVGGFGAAVWSPPAGKLARSAVSHNSK